MHRAVHEISAGGAGAIHSSLQASNLFVDDSRWASNLRAAQENLEEYIAAFWGPSTASKQGCWNSSCHYGSVHHLGRERTCTPLIEQPEERARPSFQRPPPSQPHWGGAPRAACWPCFMVLLADCPSHGEEEGGGKEADHARLHEDKNTLRWHFISFLWKPHGETETEAERSLAEVSHVWAGLRSHPLFCPKSALFFSRNYREPSYSEGAERGPLSLQTSHARLLSK